MRLMFLAIAVISCAHQTEWNIENCSYPSGDILAVVEYFDGEWTATDPRPATIMCRAVRDLDTVKGMTTSGRYLGNGSGTIIIRDFGFEVSACQSALLHELVHHDNRLNGLELDHSDGRFAREDEMVAGCLDGVP